MIEKILRLRNIKKKDIGKFLFPDESLKPDYNKLENIQEGVELLHKHVESGNHIRIPTDFDADGFTSASIIYQFLTQDLGHKNISYFIPKTKVHGIDVEDTLEHKPDLLLVTDAGTSEADKHKILSDNGVSVLVVDHHLLDGEPSQEAVVINNQLSPNFPWKALTGAPMTHLFCEAYRDKYEIDVDLDKYLDLVAIGEIGDRADLRDLGAYYYAQKGLKKTQNPFIKMIVQESKSLDENRPLTPKDVSFSIAPMINGMTRSGYEEDVRVVVDAMFGLEYQVYNTRLKDEFPVVREAFRKATSTRARQSKQVKEALEKLTERIETMGTAQNKVLLVNSTGIITDSGLNGLVAIKLAEEYQRPTLVLQYDEGQRVLRGSGRNFSGSPVEDFRGLLEESGSFNYARGHSGAFGTEISLEEAVNVIEVLNEELADVEYEELLHHVDLSYSQKPDAQEILDIASHSHIWGNGIAEPVIHIDEIYLAKKDIRFIGAKGNTWALDLQTCQGIMFNMSEDKKLALTNHEEDLIKLEVVGECGINTYNNQQRPQVIIKDFSARGISEEEQNPFGGMDIEVLPF